MTSPSSPSGTRYKPARPPREAPGRLSRLITQFVAVLVLVGVLVIATGVAPVSWIKFERIDDRVRARTQACVFFIVPYHTVWVDPVSQIDTWTRAGSVTRERRSGGPDHYSKADDVGYLKIEGPAQTSEVPIAPSSLDSVEEKAQRFLADPQARELKLFVVANWTFSLLFSGLATVFFGIIAGSVVFALGKWLWRKIGLSKPRR